MDWNTWGQAIVYAVAMVLLLVMAGMYGFAKWMPRRLRERVSEVDRPLWRRYQTLWCIAIAAVMLVLLCMEFYLRGACALPGSPAFLVQCVGFGVLVIAFAVDFFASKRFTGGWWN